MAKFLVVKAETKIFGLSRFFFKAVYGRNYGREWVFYVKCFCVLLLAI